MHINDVFAKNSKMQKKTYFEKYFFLQILKIYLSSIKCITYRIHIIEEFDQASLEVGNTESIKKREMCRFLMP